jgi:hypothetical protein
MLKIKKEKTMFNLKKESKMKNLKVMMMTLMMCLMTMVSFGQEKYTTYDNLYGEKTYEVSISHKDNGKYTLYVDMMSLDNLSKSGGIMIDEKEHILFLRNLKEAKEKYIEWVNIAKENNVKDLSKSMSYKVKVGGFFQYGSKWNFQYFVNLTFDFRIVDGKNLLIVRTGELKSSSNRYITHDGFVFVFQSEKEIDDFINILSVEKVVEFMNKPKSTDLFKD